MMMPVAALAAGFTPLLAHAAPQPGPAASAGSFFQVVLGLLAVLAVMAAIAWGMRRMNFVRAAGNAPIRIVGGVSVGNRERVMVVEVAGQWIVVGVAPGCVNALSTMARPEEADSFTPTAGSNQFAGWLKQKMEQRNAQANSQ